jgi:hypothetical protein
LSLDVSAPIPKLGQGRVRAHFYVGSGPRPRPTPRWAMVRLSLTILGFSVLVESNSPHVQLAKKKLHIEPPIFRVKASNYDTYHIPLNTNKQSILILIRCDDMNNRIILFYYYEITSLPLQCCMKQVKSGNT